MWRTQAPDSRPYKPGKYEWKNTFVQNQTAFKINNKNMKQLEMRRKIELLLLINHK